MSYHSQTGQRNNDNTPLCWHTWLSQPLLISLPFSETQQDNLQLWYSENGSPVIKTSSPLRPLSLVAGEEVSRGFPGGLRVGGGATAGSSGRLQIHLSLYRCRGILIVRLVLHFNKPSCECRHSVRAESKKAKFLILLAVKLVTSEHVEENILHTRELKGTSAVRIMIISFGFYFCC